MWISFQVLYVYGIIGFFSCVYVNFIWLSVCYCIIEFHSTFYTFSALWNFIPLSMRLLNDWISFHVQYVYCIIGFYSTFCTFIGFHSIFYNLYCIIGFHSTFCTVSALLDFIPFSIPLLHCWIQFHSIALLAAHYRWRQNEIYCEDKQSNKVVVSFKIAMRFFCDCFRKLVWWKTRTWSYQEWSCLMFEGSQNHRQAKKGRKKELFTM